LQAWQGFEETYGGEEEKGKLAKQMPRRIKKRRKLDDESFEEFLDYVFPADAEESGGKGLSKLLADAEKFKREREAGVA
jgi:crooked neck